MAQLGLFHFAAFHFISALFVIYLIPTFCFVSESRKLVLCWLDLFAFGRILPIIDERERTKTTITNMKTFPSAHRYVNRISHVTSYSLRFLLILIASNWTNQTEKDKWLTQEKRIPQNSWICCARKRRRNKRGVKLKIYIHTYIHRNCTNKINERKRERQKMLSESKIIFTIFFFSSKEVKNGSTFNTSVLSFCSW